MVMARHWRQRFLRPLGPRAAVVILAALATGCKTGSWGAKPSWWSFGGPAPAGSSLTAAPSFDADPTKPSEVAKPYPTTSTPEGYALDGGAKTAAPALAATPAVEPAAITYGTTVAARAEQPEPSFQPTSPAAPAAVGPQVGPYASLQQPAAAAPPNASDPAAAAMAGFGAAPAFEAEPPPAAQPTMPGVPPTGTRVADARGSAGWSAPPAAASPGLVDGDNRYGQANGSRFGGGFAPAAQPAFEPNPSLDPAPGLDPAPAVPAAMGSAPPLGQPQPSPPAASALPGGLAPPARRPDPGYRPGGTSSYRPNRAILADDESGVSPIQPVAYDLPATTP